MQLAVLISMLFGLSGVMMADAGAAGQIRENIPVAYELYSWQDSPGKWKFAILPHTSRNHTAAEIFDDQTAIRGVTELKRRLSKLTEGTVVFWLRAVPEVGGRLSYPPETIVHGIQAHARAHEIRLDIEERLSP